MSFGVGAEDVDVKSGGNGEGGNGNGGRARSGSNVGESRRVAAMPQVRLMPGISLFVVLCSGCDILSE